MPVIEVATVRNDLLRLLPAADLVQLMPRLRRVQMASKDVLLRAEAPIADVYFPESGVISMIVMLRDGVGIEVGLIGPEGFLGLPALLGVTDSMLEGLVQVAGTALVLPAAAFQAALSEIPSLRGVLMRYVEAFHIMVSQSVACSSRHQIEQRLARWLLMTQDRVGGDRFPMTHQSLSNILGVRRPGVTLAMGALQRAGFIEHRRGQVLVCDRPGLEAACCECYEQVQRWFGGRRESESGVRGSLTAVR